MIGWIAVSASFSAGILTCLSFYYLVAPRIFRLKLLRRRLGKVFASYSHKDEKEVKLIGQVVNGLGGEFVRDRTHIRGGENWRQKLNELIKESDTFQLFWSNNAIASIEVEKEWRFALTLGEDFIHPIYWDKNLEREKRFPPELSHLEFIHIDLNLKTNEVSIAPSLVVIKRLPANIIVLFIISLAVVMAATFLSVRGVIGMKSEGLRHEENQHTFTSPSPNSSPIPSPSVSPIPISPPRIVATLLQENQPSKKGELALFTITLTNKGGRTAKNVLARFGVPDAWSLWVVNYPMSTSHSLDDDDPNLVYWRTDEMDIKAGETIKIHFKVVLGRDLGAGEAVQTELQAVGYDYGRKKYIYDYRRKESSEY